MLNFGEGTTRSHQHVYILCFPPFYNTVHAVKVHMVFSCFAKFCCLVPSLMVHQSVPDFVLSTGQSGVPYSIYLGTGQLACSVSVLLDST